MTRKLLSRSLSLLLYFLNGQTPEPQIITSRDYVIRSSASIS
jgi:hypothetical protein